MTKYSNYSETSVMTPVMYLRVNTIVGGQYIDYSGNGYHADVVTITDTDDGIKLADNITLKEYIRNTGLYDVFYDSLDVPKEVIKSQIGRIYNNIFFNNDIYIMLCGEALTGLSLSSTMTVLFGIIDTDAQELISTLGITSELEQRLLDTHIKDLKSLNAIQSDLFKYGDLDNSVIKVLYGLIGDTFESLKYNWVSPEDADSSCRLELVSGTEVRVLPNAINFDGTFALDTNLNASIKLNTNNSFGFGSLFNLGDGQATKNITVGDSYDLGCLEAAVSYKGIALAIRRDDISHSVCENTYQNPTKGVQYAVTDSKKFFLTNKSASNSLKQYADRTQIGSTVTDAGVSSFANGNIILGNASVDGVIDVTKHSILACGYAYFGSEIDSEALQGFQDAVIRFLSAKNHYFFPPDETSRL